MTASVTDHVAQVVKGVSTFAHLSTGPVHVRAAADVVAAVSSDALVPGVGEARRVERARARRARTADRCCVRRARGGARRGWRRRIARCLRRDGLGARCGGWNLGRRRAVTRCALIPEEVHQGAEHHHDRSDDPDGVVFLLLGLLDLDGVEVLFRRRLRRMVIRGGLLCGIRHDRRHRRLLHHHGGLKGIELAPEPRHRRGESVHVVHEGVMPCGIPSLEGHQERIDRVGERTLVDG